MENYTDKFLFGLIEFFAWAKWLFFLALVLTLGDLKFGIEASRYRKDPIKRSRAVRRTIGFKGKLYHLGCNGLFVRPGFRATIWDRLATAYNSTRYIRC